MATIDTVNQYYRALIRSDAPPGLAQRIANQIDAGTLTLDNYQTQLIGQAQSSTIPALIAYNFFYGNTPNTGGLDFLTTYTNTLTNQGFTVERIYINLGASFAFAGAGNEFEETYSGLSRAAFVDNVFTQINGRGASAAERDALLSRFDEFVALVGNELGAKGAIAGLALFNAAQSGFGPFPYSSTSFLTDISNGAAVYNTGELLTNYGSGPSSVASVGLTGGFDSLLGTPNADTFVTDNTTAAVSDNINGGAGSDTLNYFTPTATPALPQLGGVEVLNFVAPTVALTPNLNGVSGLQQVNIRNSTTGGNTLTLGKGTSAGFDNVVTGAGSETVTFATAETAATLRLSNGSTLFSLTADPGSTGALTIFSTGSAANKITTFTGGGVSKSLTLSGNKALEITDPLGNNIVAVDGSGSSGGLTLGLGTRSVATTITGGSGDDTLDVSGFSTGKLTVALGAGDDVLTAGASLATPFGTGSTISGGAGAADVINVTGALTAANAGYLSDFEVLDISGSAGGALDVATLAGTSVQIDGEIGGALTGGVTLSNAPSTFGLLVQSTKSADYNTGAGITVALAPPGGTADALTLTLTSVDANNNTTADGEITIPALTATGFETLNIVANVTKADTDTVKSSAYVETITSLTAGDLKNLTISGNESVVITSALGAAVTSIDASGSTGNTTLTAASGATGALTFLGGSGIDTLTAGLKGGTFTGGSGNDVVSIATGARTGVQTFVYTAATDSTLAIDVVAPTKVAASGSASAVETIIGFRTTAVDAALHDVIDLTSFGFTGTQTTGIRDLGTSVNVLNGNFLATQATLFNDPGFGVRGVAVGREGTGVTDDTFIIVDADKSGSFSATSDLVIRLGDVGGVTLADFKFA